jgi:hypothetical protein
LANWEKAPGQGYFINVRTAGQQAARIENQRRRGIYVLQHLFEHRLKMFPIFNG